MDGHDKTFIRMKCAFVLNQLLDKNKARHSINLSEGVDDLNLVHNLAQLSSATGLRPATISNIFNGDSAPSLTSLIQILEILGSSIMQFGDAYSHASVSEINNFQKNIAEKKERELEKKARSSDV